MGIIFMNSGNSKTSDPYWLFNFSDKNKLQKEW